MGDFSGAGATVQIDYEGRIIDVRGPCRLLDALLDAGVDHRHVCGGNGFCTSCRVEVTEGASALSDVSALERDRLGWDAGKLRLACQTHVHGRIAIRVPRVTSSRFPPDDE
jgi:ferredoxin